jgi:O-antigen/teichoic acid export membrane protein
VLTVPLLLIAWLLAGPLANLFNAQSGWQVVLLGPLVAFVVGQQLISGALLGGHRFATQAATTVAEAGARALVTLPAAVLFGVSGALFAYLAGQVVSVVAAIILVGGLAWLRPSRRQLSASGSLGLAAVSLVIGLALLQSGDLVVLRWYGPTPETGLYAACASVGTLLVALSVPIYVPSFPRAIAAQREGRGTISILFVTLGLVVALGASAALVSVWLSAPVLRWSFGSEFEDAASLLPIYLLKTSAVVSAGVIGQHALALARPAAVTVVLPVSIFSLIAVALLHLAPAQLVASILAIAILLALLMIWAVRSSLVGAS